MRWVRYLRVPVPTLPAALALAGLGIGAACLAAPLLYGALAAGTPVGEGILVVEGWVHDGAVEEAAARMADGNYTRAIAVGGPLAIGAHLAEHADFAHLTAARLRAAGVPGNRVEAVAAEPVVRDRTRASALALRAHLSRQPDSGRRIDLVTVGPHARRSRRVFRRTLGRDWQVGAIVIDPWDFDRATWWHSSQGFRSVLYEAFAYLYTRLTPNPRPPAPAADEP